MVVMALAASVTTAPAAVAATELEVDAGYGGTFRIGEPVAVRVRISADRLLRGELQVSPTGGFGDSVTLAVPVEVPGGSVKEVVVAVPVDQGSDRRQIRAVLREGAAVVAEGAAGVAVAADQELVGLLPGVLEGRQAPGVVPLAVDAGTARFSALGPAELAVAPASLAGLDVIGASADDLAGLDPGARDAVLAWVAEGGHLLVDSAEGSDVEGLPPGWQPGDRGRVAAGLGEVRTTSGAMGAGRWQGLIEPTPGGSSSGGHFFGPLNLDGTLARDAGLRVPRLGWLVAFLVVYVAVAVPLTLTVLRRRGRGELGWVALPLVALVFTAVSYGVGQEARGGTTVAHATVLHTSPAGAVAASSVGVISPDGGSVEFGYPRRWSPSGRSNASSAPPTASVATLGPSGTTVRQQLDVGQFGVQRAAGPVSVDGGLTVTAAADASGELVGTVRNTLPFALEDVGVLHDRAGVAVGSLGPGEERTFKLDADRPQGDAFSGPAVQVWRSASGFDGMPDLDSAVAFPLWNEFEMGSSSDPLTAGRVVAAGWTRDYQPPLDVPGSSLSGRTMVVSTASVSSGSAGVVPATVRTDVVRGPFLGGAFDERAPLVVRLVLPDVDGAVDPSTLEVRAPEGFALDVWSDGSWQGLADGQERPAPGGRGGPGGGGFGPGGPMAIDGGGDPFGSLQGHPLPPDALDEGVVWARATAGGFGFFDPSLASTLTLVTLGSAP